MKESGRLTSRTIIDGYHKTDKAADLFYLAGYPLLAFGLFHPIIFVTFAVHCFSVSLCCRSTSPEWQFKQAPSASPLAEPSGSGAMTVPNGGRSGDGFGMPRPVKVAKRVVTATTTANGAFAVTP